MTDVPHATDLPLTEELLHEIRGRIVRALTPQRVILFGSYARNRATTDSDLDLLVVTDQPMNREEHGRRIRSLFRDIPLSVQVITISRQEFEETQDVIGGIAYPAAKYGNVIYEKP